MACFNVLAHNRDDHAKNFSFLLVDGKIWSFAPAYDLTFSYGPDGEQTMIVMGEGKDPGPDHLRTLAEAHHLKNGRKILDDVRHAVSNWTKFATAAGVSPTSLRQIQRVLNPGPRQ